MATQKKIRKNHKIKFNEENYVEKYYMKDDKAVIPIKLENISDLYMKNDYYQKVISNDVLEYIDVIAYMIPIDVNIELEIHCPQINEEEQINIKKNLKNNYGMDIDDNEYDIRQANHKSLILFIIGMILLFINIIFDEQIGSIASNFLSVVWWLAIWDTFEMQILDNRDKKMERLNNQQLYEATYSFVFDINSKETNE